MGGVQDGDRADGMRDQRDTAITRAVCEVMLDALQDEYLADAIALHVFTRADDAFVQRDQRRLAHIYCEFVPVPLPYFKLVSLAYRKIRSNPAYYREMYPAHKEQQP